jgi:SsrA-binding protein
VVAEGGRRVIIRNKKARHEYEILESFEAGLVLRGSEVKSLRAGKANFADSYARLERGELWLYGLHVANYGAANIDLPDPLRPKKLLLHAAEIRRLSSKTVERGFTLVPLDLYFTRGMAKVTLALARGKKLHDRREDLKRKAMRSEIDRALSGRE